MLIVPVLEERLVVTTELVLKEEIRITKKDRSETIREPVRLRSERVEIERLAGRDLNDPNLEESDTDGLSNPDRDV